MTGRDELRQPGAPEPPADWKHSPPEEDAATGSEGGGPAVGLGAEPRPPDRTAARRPVSRWRMSWLQWFTRT